MMRDAFGKVDLHERLGFVDALRGLAALYVFVFHVVKIPRPALPVPEWSDQIILQGQTGVTLFFIVSAFTLCLSMETHSNDPQVVRKYYIRRVFRIFPLYYFSLFMAILRTKYLLGSYPDLNTIFLNILFAGYLLPDIYDSIVWASWTIGVEVLFYILFPFLFRRINNIWKAFGFLFLVMICVNVYKSLLMSYSGFNNLQSQPFIHFVFLTNLPAFAVGLICFQLYKSFGQNRKNIYYPGLALLLAGMFGIQNVIMGNLPGGGLSFWHPVFYGAILLGLAAWPTAIIVNPLTRFFGKISFSLYLNHPVLIYFLMPVYRSIYLSAHSNTIKLAGCILITLIPLIIISCLTYEYIEKPGMKLGSKLIERIRYPGI